MAFFFGSAKCIKLTEIGCCLFCKESLRCCTLVLPLFCKVSVADCGGNGAPAADLAEAQPWDLLLSLTIKAGVVPSIFL